MSCNGRSCSGQFWKEGQEQAADRHISNMEAHGHQVLQVHHWAGGERSWVHSSSLGLGTNKPPFLSEKLNSFRVKFPLTSLWRDSFCHPIHVRCPRLSSPHWRLQPRPESRHNPILGISLTCQLWLHFAILFFFFGGGERELE